MLEYSLISIPQLEPNVAVFYISAANSVDDLALTQNCYRAEFQIKNLGLGSIVLPYRGRSSLEMQQSNSIEWHSVNQALLGILPPIRAGSVQNFQVRIHASRWQITATYRCYQPQVRFLNQVTGDFFRLNSEFGDQKDYNAIGPVWEIPPRPVSRK
jgi:hypothetical protein